MYVPSRWRYHTSVPFSYVWSCTAACGVQPLSNLTQVRSWRSMRAQATYLHSALGITANTGLELAETHLKAGQHPLLVLVLKPRTHSLKKAGFVHGLRKMSKLPPATHRQVSLTRIVTCLGITAPGSAISCGRAGTTPTGVFTHTTCRASSVCSQALCGLRSVAQKNCTTFCAC